MKIALLNDRIPPERSGGAERVVWLLALALRDAGHDVHVITTTDKPPFAERRDGIMTHHLHAGYPARWQGWLSLYNPQTVGPLRRLLAELRPDVLHAHNIHLNLSYHSLSIAQQLGIPTVWTAHDMMPIAYTKLTHFIDPTFCGVRSPEQYQLPALYNARQMRLRYNPARNWLIRRIVSRVDVRTCISEAQRQAFTANGLPDFTIVRNGIDPAPFDAPDLPITEVRARLGLTDRKVILFAGRLTAEKGSAQLFAALKHVAARLPNVTLLVLTANSAAWDRSEYRQELADHVTIGGWLNGAELMAAYKLADVVCAPSICLETGPMVALEAMAARKPAVVSCYGGAPELVVDGETGSVINPFNTAQFADSLSAILSDPENQARLGEAGYARLADNFTLAQQVERFTALY